MVGSLSVEVFPFSAPSAPELVLSVAKGREKIQPSKRKGGAGNRPTKDGLYMHHSDRALKHYLDVFAQGLGPTGITLPWPIAYHAAFNPAAPFDLP